MTRDEAISITEMILNSWPRPEWTDGQTETFVRSLEPYDPALAVKALGRAHKVVSYRPTFAEFVAFYRAARADEEASRHKPIPPSGTRKMPPWVKEWYCARFAHHRFNRPRDMRRFTQQGDWGDPDMQLMPPNEWASAAARLSDTEVQEGLANVVATERTTPGRQTQPATVGSESGVAATNGNRDAA